MSARVEATGQRTPDITIDPVTDAAGWKEIEALQVLVWGFGAEGVVPAHVLYVAGAYGGIVLGAHSGDTLVGFVLGFLGRKDGALRHISHMLGVHPDYRGHGIGEALKWRQRDVALDQGLGMMQWTFDPLEARNAHFNLHKLGTFCRTYHEDLYGDLGDRLNRGLPSDRLLVEWDLRRPGHLRPAVDVASVPLVEDIHGEPALHLTSGEAARGTLTVAAPANIQQLKSDDPRLARTWRLALRRALTYAFERGYVVTDFRNGTYVLVRSEQP